MISQPEIMAWLEQFSRWQTYVPTFGGFSVDPVGYFAWQYVNPHMVAVNIRCSANGTSNGTTLTVSAPIAAATRTNAAWNAPVLYWVDNGVAMAAGVAPGRATITSGSNVITLYKDPAGTTWTGANGKRASFTLIYEI